MEPAERGPAAMEWQESVTSLGRFGFTEREAKLYLLLLRRGRATARDLTRDSQMDRVLAYRTLDSMRARGLVQVTAERPRRYVPIPARVLFDRSLFERRRALEEDLSLSRELTQRLPGITQATTEGAPKFQVMTGADAIYPYLKEMVRRSEKETMVMITPRALRESTQFGLPQELARLLRGGGKFRLIVERDPGVEGQVRRFLRARKGFPNAEVRATNSQRARLAIVDDREALVFLIPEPGDRGVDEIAVWTDNRDFVRAQVAHFNAVWDRSELFPDSRKAAGVGSPRPIGEAPALPGI
ncbi:MAG: hypothetical protein L3J97_03525 [Thermoplasmata archaeon]|nr:hypothetical protein [Thermoplasmata archaeon]